MSLAARLRPDFFNQDDDNCPVGGLVVAILLLVMFGLLALLALFQIVCIRLRSSLCGSQMVLHCLILCSMGFRFINLVLAVTSRNPVGYCPTINGTNITKTHGANTMPLLQVPPVRVACDLV